VAPPFGVALGDGKAKMRFSDAVTDGQVRATSKVSVLTLNAGGMRRRISLLGRKEMIISTPPGP